MTRLLTTTEVGDRIGVKPGHVGKLVKAGLLDAIKIPSPVTGRVSDQSRLRVWEHSVDALLGASEAKPKRRESRRHRDWVAFEEARLGLKPLSEPERPEPERTPEPCGDPDVQAA